MLSIDDFSLLRRPLQEEVERLLPLPVSVDFALTDTDGTLTPLPFPVNRLSLPTGTPTLEDVKPRMVEGKRIWPMRLPSGEQVIVVLVGRDPMLLRKISADWLLELREELLAGLERVRLSYVDPETGLYNRRAAMTALNRSGEDRGGYFILLNAVFPRRTAAGNLQKIRETADLLLALSRGYCFSFSYGVFGLLLPEQERNQMLKTAHSLQQQLKREGMSKVQVGLGRLRALNCGDGPAILDRYWRALSMAEKRGPFGLCDIDAVEERQPHPFQLHETIFLKRLQKAWRGLGRFTLLLLQTREDATDSGTFANILNNSLPPGAVHIGRDRQGVLLLLPEHDAVSLAPVLNGLDRRFGELCGEGTVAMGVASWPCVDFGKRDIPGNCLKALLHASFIGPGETVIFDHLTLNISGDFYFEEGEYRDAIREYRRGLQLSPGDVNLLNSLGVALVECEQIRKAAVCFQEVLRKEPENYMALVNLGHVLQTLGQKIPALACYRKALDQLSVDQPGNADLFFPLARLQIECAEYAQALEVLARWQGSPGSDREFLLFRLLALANLASGNPEEAIRASERAVRLFPQDSISLSILGLLYVEQGEGDAVGLALCRKALDLDNFNPDHWYRLGRALFHIGDLAAAQAALIRGLRMPQQRQRADGLLLLARVHVAQGQEKKACCRLRQALRHNHCSAHQAAQANALLAQCSPS